MMGDRDYRTTVSGAIDALKKETEQQVSNPHDNKTIFLYEVLQCLRRSYFDRFDKIEAGERTVSDLFEGLIRKLPYGSKMGEFAVDDIKLKGQADMMVDDIVIIFRMASSPPENPTAADILYLNACMWIFNKTEGIIIYIASDGKETSFAVLREKKMFEEVIRRVRVFSNLIGEKKTPILEPSINCITCQYYERCYIKKKEGKQFSLAELFGMKK